MLLHHIQCPKCKSSLTSKAGVPEGQQLNCPKCKARFAAAAPAEEFEVIDDAEVVDDDFEEVDDEPASKKKSSAKPPKRRPADDEDDDDRPRRRKSGKQKSGYQKLKENIWLRVGTLTVLLAVLGVLTYLFIEKRKRDREAAELNQWVADVEKSTSKGLSPAEKAAEKQMYEAQGRLARRLVGRWKLAEGERHVQGFGVEYEFQEDGKFLSPGRAGSFSYLEKGEWVLTVWKSDSGEIILYGGGEQRLRFALADGDNTLILEPGGGEVRYTRIK
jgi:hypothetical protein